MEDVFSDSAIAGFWLVLISASLQSPFLSSLSLPFVIVRSI